MTIHDWLEFFKQQREMKIFHINHLKLLTLMKESSLRISLSRLSKNNAVKRICRGFYANPFNLPTLEEISGQIYQPSYISVESALSFYGILSQIPQVLTCVTTQLPQTFHTGFGTIEYHQIKGQYFGGFVEKGLYRLAEKEKALVDYLYLTPPKSRAQKLAALDLGDVDLKKAKRCLQGMNMADVLW